MNIRGLIIRAIGAAIVLRVAWKIYLESSRDPKLLYAYLFFFMLMTVIVTITKWPTTRMYVVAHSKMVKRLGIVVAAAGGIAFAAMIFDVIGDHPPLFSTDFWVWASIGPFIVGYMIAMTPRIITMSRADGPLAEFLRRLR